MSFSEIDGEEIQKYNRWDGVDTWELDQREVEMKTVRESVIEAHSEWTEMNQMDKDDQRPEFGVCYDICVVRTDGSVQLLRGLSAE